jgi:hypothetical protein
VVAFLQQKIIMSGIMILRDTESLTAGDVVPGSACAMPAEDRFIWLDASVSEGKSEQTRGPAKNRAAWKSG